MSVRVEVVCTNADGGEQRRQVLLIERNELAMETLGMNLDEGKALLAGVQDFVVEQQVHHDLERRRVCPHCRRRYTTRENDSCKILIQTLMFAANDQAGHYPRAGLRLGWLANKCPWLWYPPARDRVKAGIAQARIEGRPHGRPSFSRITHQGNQGAIP